VKDKLNKEIYFLLIAIAVGLLGFAVLSMNLDIFETEKESQLNAEHEQALRELEIARAELEYLKQTNRDSVPKLAPTLDEIGQQIRFLP